MDRQRQGGWRGRFEECRKYLEQYDISPEYQERVVSRIISIVIIIRNVNHVTDIFKMSLPYARSCGAQKIHINLFV